MHRRLGAGYPRPRFCYPPPPAVPPQGVELSQTSPLPKERPVGPAPAPREDWDFLGPLSDKARNTALESDRDRT
eukprot:3230750-Pyramimonas_sp.AAC.1